MCNCQCPIEMLIILNNPVCLDQAGAGLISKKVSPKKVRKEYGIKTMQRNTKVQLQLGWGMLWVWRKKKHRLKKWSGFC